jgi:predicted TIM-barrel fold metal-dependent hydrolase
MRIITLEDHFATPMFREKFTFSHVPEYNLAERGRYLGYDIASELLNLGDTRLAAMDATGIDLQVLSLTMPGCEGCDVETAMAMATDANDRLAEAIRTHPTRLAGFASLPTANPAAPYRLHGRLGHTRLSQGSPTSALPHPFETERYRREV